MAEERLIKYILKYVERGVPFKTIKERLKEDGWKEWEIQEAVKVVKEELGNPPGASEGDSKNSSKIKFTNGKSSVAKKTGRKSPKKSKMATWKKRLIIILSLFVLLGIAVFAGILIFG
ncbi:MAG: hypothetical protein ABEI74_02745 [Candidatus Pacearchaeota archaeon]